MIKRLIVLFVLILVVGLGIWYLLKSNPADDVKDWRTKIEKLIYSQDPSEWEEVTTEKERDEFDLEDREIRFSLARETSDSILKIVPDSDYDIHTRAVIEELDENYEEALKWYDQISAKKSAVAFNELHRCRILRKIGRFQDAQKAAYSISDVYPFESNLELGRIQLATFQALEAYRSFSKAQEHANKSEEQREILEGKVDSLNLLLSAVRNQFEFAKSTKVDQARISSLESAIKKFQSERDSIIDELVMMWKTVEPGSRGQFAGIQIKIVELLGKKNDPNTLEKIRSYLTDSVESDAEYRYFPIYLILGSINLQLAYSNSTSSTSKDTYIADAISNFERALAFEFDSNSLESVSDIAEWNLSEFMSKREFEGQIIEKISKSLISTPEYWRVLREKSGKGEIDSLKIMSSIKDALGETLENSSIAAGLRINIILALIKDRNQELYQQTLKKFLGNIEDEDKVADMAVRIAEEIQAFQADYSQNILELLDVYVLEPINQIDKLTEKSENQLRKCIKIFHRLRNQQYNLSEGQISKNEAKMGSEYHQVEYINKKLRDTILIISNKGGLPKHHLLAFSLMVSLFDMQTAIPILERGVSAFPDNRTIRLELAKSYLRRARISGAESPQEDIFLALREFLSIFKNEPYDNDVLAWLFSMGPQLNQIQTDTIPIISTTIRNLFPNCEVAEADRFAKVIDRFIRRDFEAVSKTKSDQGTFSSVSPLLNLIVGISHLQNASNVLKIEASKYPELTEQRLSSNFQEKFNAYYDSARLEFEKGLQIDPEYIPIRMEIFKMELDDVGIGEEVPESLKANINSYISENPNISQLLYLSALVQYKTIENTITIDPDPNELSTLMMELRGIIRKAIRANPRYTDAHLLLAETYVIGWRLDASPLKEYKQIYKHFGRPDFTNAISILTNAPSDARTLNRIANYHKANRDPEKALEAYKDLVQIEPTQRNITNTVQAYMDLADFDGAREWLNSQKIRLGKNQDFGVTHDTLLALISSVQSSSPTTTEHDRNLLEEKQIAEYRAIMEKEKELGKTAPPLVINNLAYILVKRGKAEEAIEIIEPLVTKIQSQKLAELSTLHSNVLDTYAWALFNAGKLNEAELIYKDLCTSENELEFHFNYAQVLFALKSYANSLEQIELIMNSEQKDKRNFDDRSREFKQKLEMALKN